MRALALAFVLVLACIPASAHTVVGVNYSNGNRNSVAQIQADLATMKQSGVKVIRVPLEKFNGSYQGTLNVITAANSVGISVLLNITISANPDFYLPDAQKRPADPIIPTMWAAYPLSAINANRVTSALTPFLGQIDAMRILLAGIEFGNEINNPAFNGDWPLVGPYGGKVIGLLDLVNADNPETAAVALGYRSYVVALNHVKDIRDGLLVNNMVPLISAGLYTPADCPAGCSTGIAEDASELNGTLSYLRANGLDVLADQYGVHSYLWGTQAKLSQLSSTLVLTQCSDHHPCAVTEWGYHVDVPGQCPSNDGPRQVENQYYRTDFAGYGQDVAQIFYFDWKSPTYGAYLCGTLQGSGVLALAP